MLLWTGLIAGKAARAPVFLLPLAIARPHLGIFMLGSLALINLNFRWAIGTWSMPPTALENIVSVAKSSMTWRSVSLGNYMANGRYSNISQSLVMELHIYIHCCVHYVYMLVDPSIIFTCAMSPFVLSSCVLKVVTTHAVKELTCIDLISM